MSLDLEKCDADAPLLADDPSDVSCETAHDRTERLRRFLLFCLAIDYNWASEAPDQLTKDDLHYYVDLGKRCFLPQGGGRPLLKANGIGYLYKKPCDITVTDAVVQTNLMDPAMAIGIPCSAVVVMLRLFIRSMHFSLRRGVVFNSQLYWLACNTGLVNLAARFYMDRHLIPQVLIPVGTKTKHFNALLARIREAQAHFMSNHVGPTTCELKSAALDLGYRQSLFWTEYKWSGQKLLDDELGPGVRNDCKRVSLILECMEPRKEDDSIRIRMLKWWAKPYEGGPSKPIKWDVHKHAPSGTSFRDEFLGP
jgi:hypothetical protein